ncbi:MAG: EAL domain-containing protein [Tissierella sp.]|nr:EAL domain-containing protein [Tissierella sp.]
MDVKILIVEDSAIERMIIKNVLREYCTLTASDGVEAMRMLEEYEGINLLILDLNMPNMNGFQVLEALKNNERYRDLSTIILTNYDELDNEIKGLNLGAVDYIRKPIHMESLKVRINVHITLLRTLQALEKKLDESERSKAVFLSHLPGLAYRCKNDSDWTIEYVSEGCYDLTGYSPKSLLHNRDLSYIDIISPEYRRGLREEWDRVLAIGQEFREEYEIVTASGKKKWVIELGRGIYNVEGEIEALEGVILDISDRKEAEYTLKYNNEHDRWTGLYNRDYLVALLEKDARIKKTSKKALIGINLSMVHLLITNYGFQYAENLIKKIAEALNRHCRENCILFRPREHSFIFYILDYKDKNELIDFSNLVAKTLESLLVTERIGGGIGILELDESLNALDTNLILRRLAIASEISVNLFRKDFEISFYDKEIEDLIDRERDIVQALNRVIEDDNAEDNLFLQYQPIMDLKTDSIFSFEALARLRTEKLGLVSPLEFIPIAEKTKLILPIGEKVIIKAFHFLKELKERGYDEITVSINISIIQLLEPDFASRLLELMGEMDINPKNIGIEITESVFSSDYDFLNSIIEKLMRAGIYIAIDDFGTGYSSLSRERELKADCMKIDKSFVDDLLKKDINKSITGDIISMAHKLGHYTIAEGVEHDFQLQYLREQNCDKVQGHLISKPLNEDDVIEFLKGKGEYSY